MANGRSKEEELFHYNPKVYGSSPGTNTNARTRGERKWRETSLKQASTFVDSPDHCANAEELLELLTEEFS